MGVASGTSTLPPQPGSSRIRLACPKKCAQDNKNLSPSLVEHGGRAATKTCLTAIPEARSGHRSTITCEHPPIERRDALGNAGRIRIHHRRTSASRRSIGGNSFEVADPRPIFALGLRLNRCSKRFFAIVLTMIANSVPLDRLFFESPFSQRDSFTHAIKPVGVSLLRDLRVLAVQELCEKLHHHLE